MRRFISIVSALILLVVFSSWLILKGEGNAIHSFLIAPDYAHLDNYDEIYSKVGRLEIGGRKFAIPISYIEGRLEEGRKKDSVFLTYILPDYRSKLEITDKEERLKFFNEGRYGALLLQEEVREDTFEKLIERRKRDLIKSENAEKEYDLSYEKWYRGTQSDPLLYYEVYHDGSAHKAIQNFIVCMPLTVPGVVRSSCSHEFIDKGLLYKITYNRDRYFSFWSDQRKTAIEFIDGFEIK